MFDGGDFLSSVLDEFNLHSLDDYTLDNIILSLESLQLDREFVSICIFDALIANQDRHCENWSVIQSRGTVYFSPIYDNGLSLGFTLSEEAVQSYVLIVLSP